MATTVRQETFEGQDAVMLESDETRVVVLPRVSGKIASVVDKSTGEELLWRNPDRGYPEPVYDDEWSNYDSSGWEDCLPNISAGPYPEAPWQDIPLPGHGEVWALPWETRIDADSVELTVQGIRLPYRFEKRISIEGKRVRLRHRIINPSAFPIHYIWATHPLFQVRPGMRIVLPEGVRMRIDSTAGGRLGCYLDEISWPVAQTEAGRSVQLDVIGGPDLGHADKLYTSRVTEGWCGLHDPETHRVIAFTFDPEKLPYIGVWINQGGFPGKGTSHYNVALEPTRAYPDDLSIAHSQGTTAVVGPGEEQEWDVVLHYGQSASIQALISS